MDDSCTSRWGQASEFVYLYYANTFDQRQLVVIHGRNLLSGNSRRQPDGGRDVLR